MYILDGFITAERLRQSRNPQEFIGYLIKEAATLLFMYYAGGKIQEKFEDYATKKYNKSIGLDARVIEDGGLKESFKSGKIEKSLKEFKAANTSQVNLYEFLHKNPQNDIVEIAKKSDIISLYKNTKKIDTRKYIDLKEIEGVFNKVEELHKQYKSSIQKGENIDKFFEGVKKLKRKSIKLNIGSSIFALGVLTPIVMLLKRLNSKDDKEFCTKKEIREKLIKEGIIS